MSNTQIQKRVAVMPEPGPLVTPEQVELVKQTVAVGATDQELALYLYDCQRQCVHPLDRLLHFTVRKDQKGNRKYTPVTSIDLMRTRAADSHAYAGSDDAVFAGTPGQKGFTATVTVWRMVKNQRCPFTATARWEEYFPGEQQGFMWRKMPHTMLGKCAEALALRKAFPRQLAGLYAKEELDQAGEGHGGWNGSGSKEAAQAVADAKLAQFNQQASADLAEIDAETQSVAGLGELRDVSGSVGMGAMETATQAPSVAHIVTSEAPSPSPRPAADPRAGRYLYPEQAEHLKLFAKAKKAIGEDAYRRCLKYAGFDRSLHIDAAHHAERILKDMRDVAAAQAKQRKLAKEKVDAEMDSASLLPCRPGSGCPVQISNAFAQIMAKAKIPLEEMNKGLRESFEVYRAKFPDATTEDVWTALLVTLQEQMERK